MLLRGGCDSNDRKIPSTAIIARSLFGDGKLCRKVIRWLCTKFEMAHVSITDFLLSWRTGAHPLAYQRRCNPSNIGTRGYAADGDGGSFEFSL